MASHKQVLEFFCVACFLLLFFICQSHAATEDNANGFKASLASSDSEGKVTLSLYYESLCPFCANFIVNELVKVFDTDLVSVVNLRLVPWGNTQITPNNSWICQHGRDECFLDMVEACAIKVWPDPAMHFKFIRCVEDLRLKNMHNKWQSCFGSRGLNQTPVRNCFNTGLAVRVEQGYADETARLNPPHRFVPWVLVNNLPLQEVKVLLLFLFLLTQFQTNTYKFDQTYASVSTDLILLFCFLQDYQNFVAYICRSYRGNNVPQVCKSHAFEFNSLRAVNSSQVCYAGNGKNITSLSHARNRQDKE